MYDESTRLQRHLRPPFFKIFFRLLKCDGAGIYIQVFRLADLRLLLYVLSLGNAQHLRYMRHSEGNERLGCVLPVFLF